MSDKVSSAPITVQVGDTFPISVPCKPSTGYVSTLAEMPKCVCLVSSTFVPGNPAILGSGDVQDYVFVAVGVGEGTIKFASIKFSHPLEFAPPIIGGERLVTVKPIR